MYIILDVQLLSELESVAAVPAEMESEQEDLHEERIFLVAEVNINDLFRICSMCVNTIIHTEENQRTLLTARFACSAGSPVMCAIGAWCIYVWERFVMLVS